MAKLNVKVAMIINTGPLIVYNDTNSRKEIIIGNRLQAMLAGADPGKLGFEVAAADDESFITFVFNRPSGRKGSVIEVAAKSDNSGLIGRIEGQFEIKIRPGAAPSLKKYGRDLDLRVTSITFNDGFWNGFNAYPTGVDGLSRLDNYFQTLVKVSDFSVD